MILVNPIESGILRQVATLHKESITTGFLSSLGMDFLECLYKAISVSKNSILIVYLEKDVVAGFVTGTLDITEVNRVLKRKCLFTIIKDLIGVVFDQRKLKKLFETYKYSVKDKAMYPYNLRAELLSIAVDSNFRGKGIAKRLYEELINFFRQKRASEFKIVVGEKLIDAQRFYEKMGAKKVSEFELHKGEKSFVYVQRIDICNK